MKTCPNCGKSVADYAGKCKYCDHDIPSYEPAESAAGSALLCPACGGSLQYDGTSPAVACIHCGNAVAVPSRPVPHPEPEVPIEECNLPLSETVEQLVRDGRSDRAVTLLRERLSIQQPDAEKVVAIIESGGYGDAKHLFKDVMYGKLK